MTRSMIIAILFSIIIVGYAHSEKTNNKPWTKEQIETIEEGEKIGEQLNSLLNQSKSMMRERHTDCIKAFGHDKFCSCLNENLAIYLSFKDYIVITINTKEELNYSSLPEDEKEVIDKAINVREQCVSQLLDQ